VYREYGDTENTELGQAWQGSIGKETAEDICSLMNMAYEQALELSPPRHLAKLLDSLHELCLCAEEASEPCLYCEAREQIEAQARTLNLLSGRIADLQRRAVETAHSQPSPSDTPESALQFIIGIAKDRRFSNEYLGNVVRSWLPMLESSLTPIQERHNGRPTIWVCNPCGGEHATRVSACSRCGSHNLRPAEGL
jgi:ribosomal protein L40E